MILECDIGNTRCKWRLLDGEHLQSGVFIHAEGFAGLPDLSGVKRVKVACVAGDKIREQFVRMFDELEVQPEFASCKSPVAGVINERYDSSSLGVDRWLAAVAAYMRCCRAVLVIDVGSALNVELVSSEGHYLGGYILPGANLMKKALLSDTGLVRFDNNHGLNSLVFGCSTLGAVSGGVNAALVGACLVAIDQARKSLSEEVFSVLLTGGGAECVRGHLPCDVESVPDLVMDGLAWVLP
jgi:type III pantothenate kinase